MRPPPEAVPAAEPDAAGGETDADGVPDAGPSPATASGGAAGPSEASPGPASRPAGRVGSPARDRTASTADTVPRRRTRASSTVRRDAQEEAMVGIDHTLCQLIGAKASDLKLNLTRDTGDGAAADPDGAVAVPADVGATGPAQRRPLAGDV